MYEWIKESVRLYDVLSLVLLGIIRLYVWELQFPYIFGGCKCDNRVSELAGGYILSFVFKPVFVCILSKSKPNLHPDKTC